MFQVAPVGVRDVLPARVPWMTITGGFMPPWCA